MMMMMMMTMMMMMMMMMMMNDASAADDDDDDDDDGDVIVVVVATLRPFIAGEPDFLPAAVSLLFGVVVVALLLSAGAILHPTTTITAAQPCITRRKSKSYVFPGHWRTANTSIHTRRSSLVPLHAANTKSPHSPFQQ